MTPVHYNGNDYYKKMLELQRRLRQSEEERMRLEERFSLLENESRSRGIPLIDNSRIATIVKGVQAVQSHQTHETCINRLRMRYIEFLEEQQARDERNHKLLGALDRVDSSLALISAKTDRLGTMRRQYEAASLLKNWYVNRRATGSVAGDSGVASQNNDGHVTSFRQQNHLSINKNNNPFISSVNPNTTTASVRNLVSPNYSLSINQPATDQRYDFRRAPSIRQETFQALPSTSSLGLPIKKNETNILTNVNPKYLPEKRPEIAGQSLQQSSQKYRYDYPRFNYNLLESSQSPLRSPNSQLGYSRDFATGRASLLQRDLSKKSSPDYSEFFQRDISSSSPPRSPSRFSKAIDITNQDYGNDDDVYQVGDIVENELERYMSRIPKLYRDRPQSPEEFDHEQNTSGDLLNVTFSDDGIDFSAEERPKDGKTSPVEFTSILNNRNPEIGKISRSKFPKLRQDTSIVETGNSRESGLKATCEGREIGEKRHDDFPQGNRDFPIASDVQIHQLPPITSLSNSTNICDNLGSVNNENISAHAKNKISLNVARDATESGTRTSVNNENIAGVCENSKREIDGNITETGQVGINAKSGSKTESKETKDNAVDLKKSSIDLENLDAKKHRIFNSVESESGNNFQEYAEDLEPWNPSELEKRVQDSMMAKKESDFDANQRESRSEANDDRWAVHATEINVSGTDDAADHLRVKKIENYAAGEDVRRDGNVEMSQNNPTGFDEEDNGDISKVENRVETSNQRFQGYNESDANPVSVDRLADQLAEDSNKLNDPNVQYEEGNSVENTYANQENVGYAQENYPQDQMQYEYPVDKQYQEGSNVETYQQQEEYESQNNAQYEGGANGGESYQYQVDADHRGQYEGYNVDEQNSGQGYAAVESNEQYSVDQNGGYVTDGDKQYVTDPNAQYVTDPNTQYVTDSNAQYVTDSNVQYGTDPNAQYVTDSNAQYVTDSNEQYVTDANDQYVTDTNEQYVTDTNEQYVTDTNEQYVTDTNEQYVTDTNEQYGTDPNQQYVTDSSGNYVTDPNQQYITDPNEPYVTDPNQQYLTDPNQQYAAEPVQEYLGDAQQYPEGGTYAQNANQEYATNEAYEQIGSTGNEGLLNETDHDQGIETAEGADNSQGYVQGYEPSIETVQSQGYDQGSDKSATQEPQNDIREDQSGKNILASDDLDESNSIGDLNALKKEEIPVKKTKDIIKSLLDSDTDSTIERNVSNAESDFDFN